MFLMSKSSLLAVNLQKMESIGVVQLGEDQYDVRAWADGKEWYSLGIFKTKEEAERYIHMICANYNDYWRRK